MDLNDGIEGLAVDVTHPLRACYFFWETANKSWAVTKYFSRPINLYFGTNYVDDLCCKSQSPDYVIVVTT